MRRPNQLFIFAKPKGNVQHESSFLKLSDAYNRESRPVDLVLAIASRNECL